MVLRSSLNRLPALYASGKATGAPMLTPAQQVEDLREIYSAMVPFEHEGAMVYIVAHIMWTNSKGSHWVFKLSNRELIKVTV